MDIEDLIARSVGGQTKAFGQVVRLYQDMAVGYAYGVLGDFALAEDAAQEAFVQAYRDLATLREAGAFGAWFRRIIYKHCDRIRRSRRATMPIDRAGDVPAAEEQGPQRTAERNEMHQRVLGALAGLSEDERTATTLFYINGYSQQQIGDFLGVPVSTVKSRLHSARGRLQKRIMAMTKETVKSHAPDEDFTRKTMEKMVVQGGHWEFHEESGELSGRYGSRREDHTSPWWGRIASKQPFPGDALVVEFEAVCNSGLDGGVIQCLLYPRATAQESAESGEVTIEFDVKASCFGKYHYSAIKLQTFVIGWSRVMGIRYPAGDHIASFARWYKIRCERIGALARLFVDDVPVYELKLDGPPPRQIWPVLGAEVSYCRFRGLRVYRPDDKYIREHSKPMELFAPWREMMDIVGPYPDKIVREASVELFEGGRSQGIRLWQRVDKPASIESATAGGLPCMRTDLAADQWSRFYFRLDEPKAWSRRNDIRLEVEYLDAGAGSLVTWHNAWYYPDTSSEDVLLTASGQWKTCTLHLRDVAFADLGRKGANLIVGPIRTGGQDLHLRRVRLLEVDKPKEAWEAVAAAYRRQIEKRKGQWTVPHYMMALSEVLRGHLDRKEVVRLREQVIADYPTSECLETYHHQRATEPA